MAATRTIIRNGLLAATLAGAAALGFAATPKPAEAAASAPAMTSAAKAPAKAQHHAKAKPVHTAHATKATKTPAPTSN
jgi:hypothetical protein